MNCKQGDLAVVVYAELTPEMIGALVEVVRFARPEEVVCGIRYDNDLPAWVCRPVSGRIPIRLLSGKFRIVTERVICDCLLRPIRPDEGEDETFQWAGKPQEVTA